MDTGGAKGGTYNPGVGSIGDIAGAVQRLLAVHGMRPGNWVRTKMRRREASPMNCRHAKWRRRRARQETARQRDARARET